MLTIRQTSKQVSKIAAFAVLSGILAVTTGCTSKRANTSEVVIAPLGIPGGQGGYTGGPIVDNSDSITSATENMQNVVYFAFDSSAISTDSANVLNQQVAFLTQNPSAKVLVAGNTDKRGSREYNLALGERRAAAVRDYLVTKGAPANNISIISYGEERPVATGDTEQDYAQNRRAHWAPPHRIVHMLHPSWRLLAPSVALASF